MVDLDINPRSPAIGRLARSYGVDPATVIAYAEQFIGAHDAAGVLTVAKHFPGHGSAVLDPHKRVVDITDDLAAGGTRAVPRPRRRRRRRR